MSDDQPRAARVVCAVPGCTRSVAQNTATPIDWICTAHWNQVGAHVKAAAISARQAHSKAKRDLTDGRIDAVHFKAVSVLFQTAWNAALLDIRCKNSKGDM